MNRKALFALALFAAPAHAADRTPWVEPPLGPVSSTGATIETESYRCTVESPYRILCMNIGRVCIAERARQETETAKTFGCAIEGNKNYPCPPWVEQQKSIHESMKLNCTPLSMGW